MKKYLKTIIKVVVSFGLILYLIFNGDIDFIKAFAALFKSNTYFIALSIIFIILNYIFSSIRWKYLIISDKKISFWYLLKLYFIGSFFNNFLPTSIGGDAYKIVSLGNKLGSKTDAFTATFLERFLGMVSLLIVAVVAISYNSEVDSLSKVIGLVVAIIVFVIFLLYYPKFKFEHRYFNKVFGLLDKIYDSFLRYKNHKMTLFISFISSFFVQAFAILSQYVLFLSLAISIPLLYSFFAFPIIFLSGYAIPTINGIGSQESLYLAFFAKYESNGDLIVAVSILYQLAKFIVSLIGGLIYLIEKKHE